jgi:hypothetical protein
VHSEIHQIYEPKLTKSLHRLPNVVPYSTVAIHQKRRQILPAKKLRTNVDEIDPLVINSFISAAFLHFASRSKYPFEKSFDFEDKTSRSQFYQLFMRNFSANFLTTINI